MLLKKNLIVHWPPLKFPFLQFIFPHNIQKLQMGATGIERVVAYVNTLPARL